MKNIITLILIFATTLAASAVETEPTDQLVRRSAHNARVPGKQSIDGLPGIDYQQVKRSDKHWIKKRVFELFKSIDPDKIKFESHKQFDTVLRMTEPLQVIFTFEARENKEEKGPRIWYYLIKVEMVGPNNLELPPVKPEQGRHE
jgi:hypothetical protein